MGGKCFVLTRYIHIFGVLGRERVTSQRGMSMRRAFCTRATTRDEATPPPAYVKGGVVESQMSREVLTFALISKRMKISTSNTTRDNIATDVKVNGKINTNIRASNHTSLSGTKLNTSISIPTNTNAKHRYNGQQHCGRQNYWR